MPKRSSWEKSQDFTASPCFDPTWYHTCNSAQDSTIKMDTCSPGYYHWHNMLVVKQASQNAKLAGGGSDCHLLSISQFPAICFKLSQEGNALGGRQRKGRVCNQFALVWLQKLKTWLKLWKHFSQLLVIILNESACSDLLGVIFWLVYLRLCPRPGRHRAVWSCRKFTLKYDCAFCTFPIFVLNWPSVFTAKFYLKLEEIWPLKQSNTLD